MPLISNCSSNLGLIFASSGVYEFIIEIWGQGFSDSTLTSTSGQTSTVVNGGGGYTKLSMIVPVSYTLQIRPQYYIGGNNITTESIGGNLGTGNKITTQIGVGGDAAGFGIDDQWLAVVGGGGLGSYTSVLTYSTISYNNNIPFTSFSFSNVSSGGNGLGGYNGTAPLSQPDVGGDASSSTSGSITQPSPQPGVVAFISYVVSGAGGAGALPGTGGSGGTAGQGGEANIKIWEEQQVLDGYLTSFPDIKMTYVDSANGINKSSAKVRITSPITGSFIDYITNQDVLVSTLIPALNAP